MAIKDNKGIDRPERKLWVYKDYTVKEETTYGYNEEEFAGQWYVLGVGTCKIGDGAFETREEAVKYGKKQLREQIRRLQGYLDALDD